MTNMPEHPCRYPRERLDDVCGGVSGIRNSRSGVGVEMGGKRDEGRGKREESVPPHQHGNTGSSSNTTKYLLLDAYIDTCNRTCPQLRLNYRHRLHHQLHHPSHRLPPSVA